MITNAIRLDDRKDIPLDDVIALYRLNDWSAAEKPDALRKALTHSHTLISAWHADILVGIGTAISDGYLVVYYPHLLVHPGYQRQGIGQLIMQEMQKRYGHFHMQMLTADVNAVAFYEKVGFARAGATVPMWLYSGNEH